MLLLRFMKAIPVAARYIISVYLAGILFFTLFRCILICANLHEVHSLTHPWSEISYAMFMGLRFDTVICGYILALPAVLLFFTEVISGRVRKGLLLFCNLFLCILFILSFFICAADIPFFHNYNNRLNSSILNWTNSPLFMVKMVWQDNEFLGYFILFVVVSIAFVLLMSRIYRTYKAIAAPVVEKRPIRIIFTSLVFSLVFLGLMFLGIRGRTDEKSPIVPGTAFFCNDNLPNQTGLNPVFTLMVSWGDEYKEENKKLNFVSTAAAAQYVQSYFHLPSTIADPEHPILRAVKGKQANQQYNVVVVLMESMSAYYLQRFGNTMNLTPNLDSLARNGYSFDNFYSAGIHTFNGIFSTLYSYPALMARHTMEGAIIPHYTGLPYFFDHRGYETIYFTTHDDQFDNVGGFLSANYVHTIISKKDYPAEEIKSTLGVPDHFLFDFSIPKLNDISKSGRPFFAMYMTGSNHNPYIMPASIPFTPKHTEVRGGEVEYADWAIGHFLSEAAKTTWFQNTVFVFVADHGSGDGARYGSLPLFYSHIPCIIYSPMYRNAPRVIKSPGGQIDVFPTIAGLAGGDYKNNTMGIDLLNDSRHWMYFSQDDKIGVADTNMLYVWQKGRDENMYHLPDGTDILAAHRSVADSMRTYAFSMIQYAERLRTNNNTGLK